MKTQVSKYHHCGKSLRNFLFLYIWKMNIRKEWNLVWKREDFSLFIANLLNPANQEGQGSSQMFSSVNQLRHEPVSFPVTATNLEKLAKILVLFERGLELDPALLGEKLPVILCNFFSLLLLGSSLCGLLIGFSAFFRWLLKHDESFWIKTGSDFSRKKTRFLIVIEIRIVLTLKISTLALVVFFVVRFRSRFLLRVVRPDFNVALIFQSCFFWL